jgi:hypothetical protein
VTSDVSRFGRESIETAWAMKQITDAGVKIFDYLADREWRLDTGGSDKLWRWRWAILRAPAIPTRTRVEFGSNRERIEAQSRSLRPQASLARPHCTPARTAG